MPTGQLMFFFLVISSGISNIDLIKKTFMEPKTTYLINKLKARDNANAIYATQINANWRKTHILVYIPHLAAHGTN